MDEGTKQQVLALKREGMSAADIAACLGLEGGTVDMVLVAFDKKVAKEARGDIFNRVHAEMARDVLLDVMVNGRSDMARIQAATLVHDEAMGRRTPDQNAKVIMNFHLEEINNAIRRSRKELDERTIDV